MRYQCALILTVSLFGCRTTQSSDATSFTSWPDERSEEVACQHYALNTWGKGYRCERIASGSPGSPKQLVLTGQDGAKKVSSQFDQTKSKDEVCSSRRTAVQNSLQYGYQISKADVQKAMAQNCNTTSVVQQWQEANGVAITVMPWRPRKVLGAVYLIDRGGNKIALPATNSEFLVAGTTPSGGGRGGASPAKEFSPPETEIQQTMNAIYQENGCPSWNAQAAAGYGNRTVFGGQTQRQRIQAAAQQNTVTAQSPMICRDAGARRDLALQTLRTTSGIKVERTRIQGDRGTITVSMEPIE